MWVVLFHLSAGQHVNVLKSHLPPFVNMVVFDLGHFGVQMFFALSGFVMALTVPDGISSLKQLCLFIGRRLIRLTPPYYFAVGVAVFLVWIKLKVLGVGEAPDFRSVAIHLTYLQDFLDVPALNAAFWTLCIEVQFYFAYAVFLWGGGHLLRSISSRAQVDYLFHGMAWLSAALTLADAWPHVPGLFLPFWYSFLAGVLACHAWRRDGLLRFSSLFFLVVLTAVALSKSSGAALTVGLTALSLALVGLAGKMQVVLNVALLQQLALMSYSLYLLHNPITGAVANLVRRAVSAGVLADFLVGLASVSACIMAAWISYKFVELPSIRWGYLFRSPTIERHA
jgi:peptidoglycan/LPS O-acetylase OafA/YrhL